MYTGYCNYQDTIDLPIPGLDFNSLHTMYFQKHHAPPMRMRDSRKTEEREEEVVLEEVDHIDLMSLIPAAIMATLMCTNPHT